MAAVSGRQNLPVPDSPPASRPVLRHAWSESDRFVPRSFVRPAQRFMRTEASGGIAMLIAAVVALVWANSPFSGSYEDLWRTRLEVNLGELIHLDHLDLRAWVNDGLMAIFFFVVGLEIKRELVLGDLRDRKAAALPAIAALGGMVVPALVYTAFNFGGDGARGWGVPMATDIAFAVGIVSLLGRRVPTGAKIFLLTLAVVDDIGAIIVIAIFYAEGMAFGWLAAAFAGLGVILLMRRGDVRSLVPYLTVGAFVWLALLESGVHATLAGVVLGVLTPVWSFYDPKRFGGHARRMVGDIERRFADDVLTDEEHERNQAGLEDLARLTAETASPLERLEHRLAPWVAFGVVPIFALANAGVSLSGDAVDGALTDPVILGVALGLLVGKTVGVFGATWLAARLGIGRLPAGTTWRHVLGLAVTAGVGFTVALFVASLAYRTPELTDAAKIGILAGSLLAGILGYLFLRSCPVPDHAKVAASEPGLAGDRPHTPTGAAAT
ncbi:Na+/H+ antiporter NhaA [soil metagenome]